MIRRAALLGSAAGTWMGQKPPMSMLERLMIGQINAEKAKEPPQPPGGPTTPER